MNSRSVSGSRTVLLHFLATILAVFLGILIAGQAFAAAVPSMMVCSTTPQLTANGFPVVLCDSSGRPIAAPLAAPPPPPTPPVVTSASSGNVANATATAALAAQTLVTNYMTGLQITAGGATAAACVVATVTGVAGGGLSFIICAPAGASIEAPPFAVNFIPPLPATAVNTAITLSLPALGAGNTNAAVSLQGYAQ